MNKRDMISVLPHQVKANAMEIPYLYTSKIAIKQYLKEPSSTQLESSATIILVLPPAPARLAWNRHPFGEPLRQRWNRHARGASVDSPLVTELPNATGTRVIVSRTLSAGSTFEQLTRARKLAAKALATKPANILVHCLLPETQDTGKVVENLTAALLAAVCPMPSMKSKSAPAHPLKRIDYFGLHSKTDLSQVRAEIQGNHLARWLTNLPPNHLTPSHYIKHTRKLARDSGWTIDILGSDKLEGRKAGAFLAVTRASETQDAAIVRLSYRPAGQRRPTVALVGKGICFDTGGVNLKTARYMHGMHEDMEGSAVALGTLLALSLVKVDFGVDCWLALAENHIGPAAYKPNDVVTASNGTTIEIIHTDAEGRMVLADTLAIAAKTGPQLMVDYATLTGACVNALSTRLSGVFSNRDGLVPALVESGRESGERVWPFPMDSDFDEALDSKIADIKQCTLGGEADHILAARFLDRFVPEDIAWIHVDLAAGNHKSGLAHIPTDVTGFGVRFTLNLLLNRQVLLQKEINP